MSSPLGSFADLRSVSWKDGALRLIDQRLLPTKFEHIECKTVEEVVHHVKVMTVRGAPAIGASGAFGMAIAAFASEEKTIEGVLKDLTVAKTQLDASRPTAVNLSWATAHMLSLAQALVQRLGSSLSVADFKSRLLDEAKELAEDDVRINRRLGDLGAAVIPQGANILHHCNTGSLATVQFGTALGIIYASQLQGKNVHVWVDETRPRLQGARLTAWELMQAQIPMHLIADNAAGLLMRTGKVDVVVFGADRVAANGDVANKVGTYKLAVVARENGIPVYAAVPTSTIDLDVAHGDDIHIEERDSTEVTHVGDTQIAPTDCPVYNPAFDVTPFKYLTGIVTEEGICYPPFSMSLRAAKEKAQARVAQAWEDRLKQIK